MTTTLHRNTQDELVKAALSRIDQIDFTGVRLKLANTHDGPAWSAAQLDYAQERYCQFLALTFAYPDRTIVPDRLVDAFWHQHILDTRAYAKDCAAVLGHFLHHFPYLGTRGKADEEALAQCFADTAELLVLHFGEDAGEPSASGSKCGAGSCSQCSNR